MASSRITHHEERRISAEQPQPTADHHTITTARRPDHIHLSALVRSRSTQFIVHASSQLGHGPSKRGHFSAILAGFYLDLVRAAPHWQAEFDVPGFSMVTLPLSIINRYCNTRLFFWYDTCSKQLPLSPSPYIRGLLTNTKRLTHHLNLCTQPLSTMQKK